MKAEFIEILQKARKLIKEKQTSFVCAAILDQIRDKINEEKSTYYESSLYSILSEGYFKTDTLIYKLRPTVNIDDLDYEDYRVIRIAWIDFLIGYIISIHDFEFGEHKVLEAAEKATASLIEEILEWE